MRLHLKLNFANPALFATGFIFLFFVPYLYPSFHFPYLKVFSFGVHLLITLFLLLLIIGASKLSQIRLLNKSHDSSPVITKQFFAFSKFIVFISIIMNVLIIIGAYKAYDGNVESAKDSIHQFGGINIISQLYLLFLPPVLYYGIRERAAYKVIILVLGFVLLIRAGLMAERLAFLEFLVPLFITYILATNKKLMFTKIVKYFSLLLGFFMLLELTRQFYNQYIVTGQNVDIGFALSWTFERFFAYYADTTNKFYYSITHELAFTTHHYLTPFVRILGRISSFSMEAEVVNYGNYRWRDFTNPGGLTMLFTDFGWFFIAVFGLFFLIFFKAYRSLNKGSLFALCLYPNLVTGILELPRFVNFYQTRFFVPLVFFMIVYTSYHYLRSHYAISKPGNLQIKRGGENIY